MWRKSMKAPLPRLRTQVLAVLVAMAFTFCVMVPPDAVAATKGTSATSALAQGAASGTLTGGTLSGQAVPTGSTFNGVLSVTNFTNTNGLLTAVGTITGSILDSAGNVLQTVTGTFTAAVTSATGSCQILSLTLGPLHLNLLGLVVDLNQVVLTITAVPGAGNLLGNLLCDIANLLNSGGPLSTLIQDLNSLLAAL
jgi:hypothetical protein